MEGLENIRVLELPGSFGTAYASWLLRGLGANVLMAETPGTGHPLRRMGPFDKDDPHPEKSLVFAVYAHGKQSVTINTSQKTGEKLLHELLDTVDVLVHGLALEECRQLAIDGERLRQQHPTLVSVAVTPFGQTGPYASYKATEINTYAVSGKMNVTGDPNREPIKPWGLQCHAQGGAVGCIAALSGILWRDFTGQGQHADVSMMEAMHIQIADMIFNWLHIKEVRGRQGNRVGTPLARHYPDTVLPTRDGFVYVGAGRGGLDDLAAVTNTPELSSEYLKAAPLGHADEIDELLIPWLSRHTKEEAANILQSVWTLAGEVLSPKEVFEDDGYAERSFFVESDHPVLGSLTVPSFTARLDGVTETGLRAPLLGEHNKEIYGSLLGYSSGDIVRLYEASVI